MDEAFECPRCKTCFVAEIDDMIDDDELPLTCPKCFCNFDPDAPAPEKPFKPGVGDLLDDES